MLRRFIVSALIASTLVVVAAPAPAGAAPARVLLEGRGWGHGRGMGQWGARGMARDGVSWNRILHHYYSGVRIGRAGRDQTRMRVLLDTRNTVTVNAQRSFRASWSGRRIAARAGRFYRFGDGVMRSSSHRNGPWRRVASTRGAITLRGARIAFVSRSGERRAYNGYVRLVPSHGRLRVLNIVSLRHYLRGVVPREMPSSWPLEALKAQSVAARTYALRVRAHARNIGAAHDICDDARCQVYAGAAKRRNAHARWQSLSARRVDRALRATRGRVLTYRGALILAEYSSSTGGATINGGKPYLRRRPDRADRISPLHTWSHSVSGAAVTRAWPAIGTFRRMRITARDNYGPWNGRAQRVLLVGSRRSIVVPAEQVRSRLGLRSTWFRVARAAGAFVFRRNMGTGTQSGDVGFLQRRLRAEGYYPRSAPVTSYFGAITRASVRRYQRAHRITATGFVGVRTRAALNRRARAVVAGSQRYRFRRNMGYGSTGAAVTQLQRRLRAEGVYPRSAPFTRFFGPITKASLQRYQRAHGIQRTGFLGPITRRSLNR